MFRSACALALFLLFSAPVQAYLVISDVDDTVKITNSASDWQSTWNGLFKNAVFAGMPETYRAWAADGATIYFVTGSPTIVGKAMRSMFKHHKVPYRSITLRVNPFSDTYKYKMSAITKLMNRHPNEQVVLVGDDVSKDQAVYRDIAAKYPGRVLATYIHRVKNQPSMADQVTWLTAYDIAITEREQGRLKNLAFVNVAATVLEAPATKLFPSFAYCPAELDGLDVPTEHSTESSAQAVEDRIEAICQARE